MASAARVRVTAFDGHYDDLIEFLSKSALVLYGVPRSVAAATSFGAYVNSSWYRAQGLEISLDGKVGSHLIVSGQYTYLDAVVTQSFASSALLPAFNPAYPGVPIGAFAPLAGGRPFRRAPNTASLYAALVASRAQVSVMGNFVGRRDGSTFLSDASAGIRCCCRITISRPAIRKWTSAADTGCTGGSACTRQSKMH